MKKPFAMAAAALFAAGSGVMAAEPATAVDTELLEFLGSIDVEDEAWREYLAERPVRPEAGKADRTPEPKQKTDPPPRGSEQREKVKQP